MVHATRLRQEAFQLWRRQNNRSQELRRGSQLRRGRGGDPAATIDKTKTIAPRSFGEVPSFVGDEEGSLQQLLTNCSSVTLQPGDVLYVPAGVIHRARVVMESDEAGAAAGATTPGATVRQGQAPSEQSETPQQEQLRLSQIYRILPQTLCIIREGGMIYRLREHHKNGTTRTGYKTTRTGPRDGPREQASTGTTTCWTPCLRRTNSKIHLTSRFIGRMS